MPNDQSFSAFCLLALRALKVKAAHVLSLGFRHGTLAQNSECKAPELCSALQKHFEYFGLGLREICPLACGVPKEEKKLRKFCMIGCCLKKEMLFSNMDGKRCIYSRLNTSQMSLGNGNFSARTTTAWAKQLQLLTHIVAFNVCDVGCTFRDNTPLEKSI